MLIFSVLFQFFRMHPRREQYTIDLPEAPERNNVLCSDRGWLYETRPHGILLYTSEALSEAHAFDTSLFTHTLFLAFIYHPINN